MKKYVGKCKICGYKIHRTESHGRTKMAVNYEISMHIHRTHVGGYVMENTEVLEVEEDE